MSAVTGKGPRTTTVELSGRPFTFSLPLSAMVALEEHFAAPGSEPTFDDILIMVEKGSFKAISALLWCMARSHHPELSLQALSTLIDENGGLVAVVQQVMPEEVAAATAPAVATPATAKVAAPRRRRARGARR